MDKTKLQKSKRKCPDCKKYNISIRTDFEEGQEAQARDIFNCRICNKEYFGWRYFRNDDTKQPTEKVNIVVIQSVKTGKKYYGVKIEEGLYLVKIDGQYHEVKETKLVVLLDY